MLVNIKSKSKDLKYKAGNVKKNYIKFSWQYLTSNKKYTFDYFAKAVREELKARQELSRLLIALSKHQWTDLTSKNKTEFCGFETLEVKRLNIKPTNYTFSKDEKVVIFRFCADKYRLIGIQTKEVFEIIGYDFNHSAYDHGN